MLFDAVHLFLWIDGQKHLLDRPFSDGQYQPGIVTVRHTARSATGAG